MVLSIGLYDIHMELAQRTRWGATERPRIYRAVKTRKRTGICLEPIKRWHSNPLEALGMD